MARALMSCCFMILSVCTQGQDRWYVNFTPGISFVTPAPLSIRQEGHPTLRVRAIYKSYPLKSPVYYSVRFGFDNSARGWEIEMNHLKVYLEDRPPEVNRFSISHGYNQVFINRTSKKRHLTSKAGIGVVAAHPENTIRGETLSGDKGIFNKGYYLTGPAFQYGVSKESALGKHLFILSEARVSVAYARVPVVNGKAVAPVMALHLQIGPGYRH